MALDGFFLKAYTDRLRSHLEGLKIEKIYQLSNDLILHFRGRTSYKLRLSADSANPRILLTEEKIDTPQTPPMFCMLMRKHLTGAVVTDVRQEGLERIITLVFSARNDFGDRVEKRLIIEIMGKHSNLLLTGDDQRIVDSIKRVNPHMSPRPIGPGLYYSEPPSIKVNTETVNRDAFISLLASSTTAIQKALYGIFTGISPVLASSLLYDAKLDGKAPSSSLTESEHALLYETLRAYLTQIKTNPKPYTYWLEGQLIEFSAIPLNHLKASNHDECIEESFDVLLEKVYKRSNDSNRLVQKGSHLVKLIHLTQDRLLSKIINLEKDLSEANKLDALRLYGELLTANLHAIEKGMKEISVLNYYSGEMLQIPLDVTKSPNENAQRYYKRYNKAKTTLDEAQHYKELAQADYTYLEGVKTLLLQAELPEDVDAIKEELSQTGFLKITTKRKEKQSKKLPPYTYTSFEGVTILVGRNNIQNDELTLKKSYKEHIWLHTKDVPGSHVIIQAEFPEIDEQTIVEAANIAAFHSKARYSSQVAVDFTEVKFVKKTKGAKPGLVIYEDFKTIYVTPEESTIRAMRK